jgi:hypothetical protein
MTSVKYAGSSGSSRMKMNGETECPRVIRSLGVIGDYRWGRERKQAMIAWENVRATAGRPATGKRAL